MLAEKKKKLLVITYGSHDHASSRIRALNYFRAWRKDFEITWIPERGNQQSDSYSAKIRRAIQKRLLSLARIILIFFRRFDLVFIQVSFLPAWQLKLLKSKGARIVYDFDDAVYLRDPLSFEIQVENTDHCIVASPELSDHAGKNHTVIFSAVDTELIKPSDVPQPDFNIIWIGSSWTGRYLQDLLPCFEELQKKMSFKLTVVGCHIKSHSLNIQNLEWSAKNELLALETGSVGIMPLRNDEWSRKKGGYKLYLYMAAGIPVVASPVGINREIVKSGINGFLAETPTEWLNCMTTLYDDMKLRKKMGADARKDAEEQYSYKACTPQTLKVFKSILK